MDLVCHNGLFVARSSLFKGCQGVSFLQIEGNIKIEAMKSVYYAVASVTIEAGKGMPLGLQNQYRYVQHFHMSSR